MTTTKRHINIGASQEFEEDEALNLIAEGRDRAGARFISHKETWN